MLDVLDYLVDKGNMNIWSSISSKKFFQSLLNLLKTRDIPEVQMKLLGLIQKWGLNFEDKRSALPNFYSVYNKLRNSNVQFPNDFESNYQAYISNSTSNNYKKNNNYENRNDDYENENENENSDKEDGETFIYMDSLKNKLKVPNFEHKYRRLVNFLVKMHDNIQMANLLMDSGERSGLKDIINTLREGNNTLIDTISGGRLKDEKLMEITLGTTEDINQTLNRDEDIKNGYKPKKFTSYFVLNNVIPIKGSSNNYRTRAKSTKPKKTAQRRDEKYKNYDMDLNGYNQNKYKEKVNAPKNADDIFDLFSASNPSNEPGYNQQQNNQPINSFFSSQTQIRGNSNNNQYPQLRNNPMTNLFNNNNNNRNNNKMNFSTNFQGNNPNNNFGRQFNQNNNQQRPVMTNFDILEQKLNNLNFEQNNNNNFNFNSQSTQINQGFSNNNMNNNVNNNNNNNNLMNMLDQLGPVSQGDTNQLVPYIGNFNQNNNNMNNKSSFINNNNNNSLFNNFNNNNNNNNPQFNNFNNNNNNNRYGNNQFNNSNNFNNNSNNYSTNFNNSNNNNQFNNNQSNFGSNNNDRNMFNAPNNNQMNFDTNLGRNQNMNDNNFGMEQNNNQQMNLEELEKQRKLKELDDLF